MSQRRTLGGDRLGSGQKQKVDTATFNRSSHDLGYVWRSTMSAGTLVPFMCEVGITGDAFDINLGCEVLTLPTVGPLFGSMKVQLDIFSAPVRLYQGQLHNNKLGIGLNMASVKLPYLDFPVPYKTPEELLEIDVDNWQINPSCILSYLGCRGFGIAQNDTLQNWRRINAIPLLAYWEIFKQYYSNKQERSAWVIHNEPYPINEEVTDITDNTATVLQQWPATGGPTVNIGDELLINTTSQQNDRTIMIAVANPLSAPTWILFEDLYTNIVRGGALTTGVYAGAQGPTRDLVAWRYVNDTDPIQSEIKLKEFYLEEIDLMREAILGASQNPAPFNVRIDSGYLAPYNHLWADNVAGQRSITGSQEGLAVKTYQSDLFNNWLNTEYIDGVNGIAAVTAVSTAGDEFTIDSLILHKKVYDMLNDVLVSGGTYDDWNEIVYDMKIQRRAEMPIYWGSLIKDLQFQEVVSNAETETPSGPQPLGTLAGRGRLGSKHKGGNINVRLDEISMLIGIVSITPRLDYSQGNEWFTSLETMDDFHKPHLDEIGFQELITSQMAWWDSQVNELAEVTNRSAGKQPAWINYMTNTNKVKGNFAIENNSAFMVLLRRYTPEAVGTTLKIKDLTTYINPAHFNHIFAQTSLDSQNYWVQIGVDMTARRKMSARVMPNL